MGAIALTLLFGIAGAAGVTYASGLLSGDGGPRSLAAGDAGQPCDTDGVVVGYDIHYDQGLAGFAVSAVRVVGIASDCDGGSLTVDLTDAHGEVLTGATASTTVDGPTARLGLGDHVPAATVAAVHVSLEGSVSAEPPVLPPPTEETPPTPTTPTEPPVQSAPSQSAPSLCSGQVSVEVATAGSSACGAVKAPPTGGASDTPVPVASWAAGTFVEPVTVKLVEAPAGAVRAVGVGVRRGAYVELSVVVESTGAAIHSFEGAVAIDFPAEAAPDLGRSLLAAHSQDGITWTTIPRLASPSLPAGQPDGWFMHADGTVTIFTRHATLFALAAPAAKVAGVRGRVRANGLVALSWKPSQAGLGLRSYRILRDGRLVKSVRAGTTRTTVGRPGAGRTARYRIAAVDAAGHAGPASIPVTVRGRRR
jgi:hypothetical protein